MQSNFVISQKMMVVFLDECNNMTIELEIRLRVRSQPASSLGLGLGPSKPCGRGRLVLFFFLLPFLLFFFYVLMRITLDHGTSSMRCK